LRRRQRQAARGVTNNVVADDHDHTTRAHPDDRHANCPARLQAVPEVGHMVINHSRSMEACNRDPGGRNDTGIPARNRGCRGTSWGPQPDIQEPAASWPRCWRRGSASSSRPLEGETSGNCTGYSDCHEIVTLATHFDAHISRTGAHTVKDTIVYVAAQAKRSKALRNASSTYAWSV
jgi:hypothetical protein